MGADGGHGSLVLRELAWDAEPAIRARIAQLGRTEDVRFAPDNRRLAIAAFFRDTVLVADVEVGSRDGRPRVVVTGAEELTGPGVGRPHGLEFLDPETIVVASRACHLSVFRLPPGPADGRGRALTRVDPPRRGPIEPVVEPGSVRRDGGADALLVCDNAGHRVTRHRVTRASPDWAVHAGDVYLRRGLDVPDSVAVSGDGRYVAVSNANRHCVMVYARDDLVDADARPCAVLRGVVWPHGLCFTDAGDLVVADAGRPFVHVFAAQDPTIDGPWAGVRYPDRTVPIMSDETFARGNHNYLEGGAKGLDIDRTGGVLVTTCAEQPLAFFAMDDLLDPRRADPDASLRLDFELTVLEQDGLAISRAVEEEAIRTDYLRQRTVAAEVATADAEARARESDALRQALEQTKTFRVLAPFRRWYGRLRDRTARRGGPS